MSWTGLREVSPDDNDALRRLERRTPQGSRLVIYSERDDYLYRGRLYGGLDAGSPGRHRAVVAVDRGVVFGVLAASVKTVHLVRASGEAEDGPAALFYDLRMDPAYRTSTLGRLMLRNWLEMERWAAGAGARIIYGMVKSDNAPMLRMLAHKEGYGVAGRMVVVSRPVYRKLPVAEVPELVDLSADGREMARAVAAEYGSRALFPAELRDAYITRPMQSAGYFSCYRLMRGASWASVGLYRIHHAMRTRVLVVPWYYRAARAATERARAVLAVPYFPHPGGAVRYNHLFNHLAKGPRGLALWRDLVRYLNNVALDDGVTLLTSMFDPSDRFCSPFRRGSVSSIRYQVVCRPLDGVADYTFSPIAVDVRDMD